MTDDLPEEVTVTMRVANAPVQLPGHETDSCDECGETVVVNPATVQSIETGEYPPDIICLQCMKEVTTDA